MCQKHIDVIKRGILMPPENHEAFLAAVEPAIRKRRTEGRNVSHHTNFDWIQETSLLIGLDEFRRKWPG